MYARKQDRVDKDRRLLNDHEIARVKELKEAFQQIDESQAFACSGSFPASAVDFNKIALFCQAMKDGDAVGAPQAFKLPLTNETAKEIYDAGEPSPFGRGKDLVYDDAYRQARELKPPHFALTYDLLSASAFLPLLAEKLDYEVRLEARVNKLNAYGPGGFFKAHKDTPLGKDHIGTLMLCLPSPFEGGELVIRQNGITTTFDWANQVKDSIAWGFLFSDCEHEVLPVKSGIRITIAYDIYISRELSMKKDKTILDTRLEPMRRCLRTLIDDVSFLPEGGSLAIGLAHGYPLGQDDSLRDFETLLPSRLKAGDAILWKVVEKFGLERQWLAIYDKHDLGFGLEYEYGSRSEKQNKTSEAKDFTYQPEIILGDSFVALEGEYFGECSLDEFPVTQRKDLVWVTFPRAASVKNTYIAYGNEPQSETAYAAVALEVTIPSADKRTTHLGAIPETKND
ncbi:hypothetical protein IAR55_006040 [Kwoniella newhampshirensis]|uniref:Fe2OG dioxygenase domain-containing protein n=1 Tax=Kwoniella newhampshirensis TaxID=1651941 RepID=A0AAW0YEW1_9TREE